jgi:hypothetical protein
VTPSQNRITQQMMMDAATAIVAKNRTVEGWEGLVSLWQLGYRSVGVDEVGANLGSASALLSTQTQN